MKRDHLSTLMMLTALVGTATATWETSDDYGRRPHIAWAALAAAAAQNASTA